MSDQFDTEFEDGLDEVMSDSAPVAEFDPSTVVTIKTFAGQTRFVTPVEGELLTVSDAIMKSGLNLNGSFETWMNGASLKMNDVVPVGSTLTLMASVKGGC